MQNKNEVSTGIQVPQTWESGMGKLSYSALLVSEVNYGNENCYSPQNSEAGALVTSMPDNGLFKNKN